MSKGRIVKIVGTISDEIVEKYKLYDHQGEEIVQSLDLYQHIAKHVKEFDSVDSYNYTISNIPKIISQPDFVYYDSNKKSLLYLKQLYENVCVVVKLKLRNNKDNYISSIYPINEHKIERLKELSYIVNR